MVSGYALLFCRVVTGLVFAVSALGKARDMAAFERAITNFKLLPSRHIAGAARLCLVAEIAIAFLMIAGGVALWAGFVLAITLLLIFSAALRSVIRRRIQTACACFGPTERRVAPADVWRNAGLILCALGGCGALATTSDTQEPANLAVAGVIGMAAVVFVMIWVQLGDIVQLLRQSS